MIRLLRSSRGQIASTADLGGGLARWGALAWIMTLQFFLVEFFASQHTIPAYDPSHQVISDLMLPNCALVPGVGNFCSPWHLVVQASLCLQGVFMFGGALAQWNVAELRVARWFCVIAGVALIPTALIPENTWRIVHVAGAAAHCIGANAVILVLAYHYTLATPNSILSPLARLMTRLGIAGTLATGLLPFAHQFGLPAGIVERIAVYPFPAALMILGARHLRGTASR